MSVDVFCMLFAFQVYSTKRSPIARKLLYVFSGPKEDLEASGGDRRLHEGGTSQQGAPTPWARPDGLGPPCGSSDPNSSTINS